MLKGIRIFHCLCSQLLNIIQNQLMHVTGFDFVAGTHLAADSVIGLAGEICLADGFTFLLGGTVNILSSDLLIPCLHGFPTGGTALQQIKRFLPLIDT